MRWALLIAFAVATGGCSILLEPDRDAIVRGMDAGPDARVDAGPDARVDAGCVPEQAFETSCNDDVDNDCDGLTDCEELECGASGFCCDMDGGGVWPVDDLRDWAEYPFPNAANIQTSSVDFGTGQVAISHGSCAPLAFGMRFDITFKIQSEGTSNEFASFVLAPVAEPRGGSFLADFRLRVGSDAHARAERGGALIGETMRPLPATPSTVPAAVDLTPGVDSMGRPVLFVSASIGGQVLVTDYVLMPLDDLRGASVGCEPDGLFVVLEGRGSSVQIASSLSARTRDCDSPTQFYDDSTGVLGGVVDRFATGPWRAGGLGEPTLSHVSTPSAEPSERVDVFADAARLERSDEFLRPTDFAIGGTRRFRTRWIARGPAADPELLGPMPSSREPSVFVPNDAGVSNGITPLLAFAREDAPGSFEIALTTIALSPVAASPGVPYSILRPSDVSDCESLRDPSLIALGPMPQSRGLLVFFTCEPTGSSPPWIGAAHIRHNGDVFEMRQVFRMLVTPDIVGDYGQQGVFSPEVIITRSADAEGEGLEIRLWFLARSSSGRVRVALAYGEVATDGTPELTLFAGNPILDAEDAILGGTCPLGCSIDSLAVMRTTDSVGFWNPPAYVFLIERTVFRTDGVDHFLVPLRQPRPNGG